MYQRALADHSTVHAVRAMICAKASKLPGAVGRRRAYGNSNAHTYMI
jgi:hypothetical protein